MYFPLSKSCHRIIYLLSVCLCSSANAAVTQMLNDSFFSNPAELGSINQSQLTLGSVFINPYLHYEGSVNGDTGEVSSSVYDTLPYLLTGYRLNERWVIGFNILPSSYANLEWPMDSFVSEITTRTKALYYRFGVQSSYQLDEKWSFGAGFNVEDNAQYFINFVVPGQGNQINTIKGINYTADLGLYYKINSVNKFTLAGYTQVNTYGLGSSTSYTAINPNLSLNVTQAPVIYAGLQHAINAKWFLEEKIYWSGWSIQHNLNFSNTTNGSYVVPTNWKDVWSFQLSAHCVLNNLFGLLSSIIYETNPVPLATNSIGYPLAAAGSLSVGVDISLTKKISVQSLYTYGSYLPKSAINNIDSTGIVNSSIQAGVVQFIFKN